jgi:AraC-like DNA-binding protein
MAHDKTPVSWLLDALCECGLDRSALLNHAGLTAQDAEVRDSDHDAEEDELLATVTQYNQIHAYAAAALQEPAMGLAILDQIAVEQMGLIGLLTGQGPTLRKSLVNLSTYQPIFSSVFIWSPGIRYFEHELIYEVKDCSPEASRHDIEFSLGIVARFLSGHYPSDAGVLSVEFAFSAPRDLTRYVREFGPNVTFDAPWNCLSIADDSLDRPLPYVDPRLSAILEAQAKRVLDDLNDKPDLVRQVETIIALGLGLENLSIESVASRLHVHPRTLHRRLIQHGSSFRQLKDNIVIRSAQDALLQTDLSITDIALNVGYSENSAFTRTFKRVCDVSPSQYRRVGRKHI